MGKFEDYAAPCVVSPDCLECPLSACKFDDPVPFLVWSQQNSWQLEVERLIEEGLPVREIAERTGIQTRVIYRLQRNLRRGEGHLSPAGIERLKKLKQYYRMAE